MKWWVEWERDHALQLFGEFAIGAVVAPLVGPGDTTSALLMAAGIAALLGCVRKECSGVKLTKAVTPTRESPLLLISRCN